MTESEFDTLAGAALSALERAFEASVPDADVQAKGEWANGKWTVEFKRKLNTGHKDDTVLAAGKTLGIAVATFDKAEKSDHTVSKVITLKIQ